MKSARVQWDGLAIGWGEDVVLTDASLAIDLDAWNRRVPIVGPSGCGKSTLLYGISGMAGVKAGAVRWTFADGQTASWGPNPRGDIGISRDKLRQRRFAFAFQDSALLPHLTIRDNLRYPIEIAIEKSGLSIHDIDRHIHKTLSRVLIGQESPDEFLVRRPNQVSGGQRRRIAIAQAMMTSPEMLFLDEPAGGLDPETKRSVMEKIDEWVDSDEAGRRAVFWVTHHRDDREFHQCRYVVSFVPDADKRGRFRIDMSDPGELLHSGIA